MWFEQLFGDTARFAVKVGFDEDPTPPNHIDPTLRTTWGVFELWAQGRCLTRSDQRGAIRTGIEWYLQPLFRWLDDNAEQFLNEEPFPTPVASEEIPSAAAWLDASLAIPTFTPTSADDDRWFDDRYEYWARHALGAVGDGACWPNVNFRRVGEHVEISWDNEGTAPARTDLRFIEPRGSVLVEAELVEATLRQAVKASVAKLNERKCGVRLNGPLANGHGANRDAWKWLVAPSVRSVLARDSSLQEIRSRLEQIVPRTGALVPHTPLTSWLRATPLSEPADITKFDRLTSVSPMQALTTTIQSARMPSPASLDKPWRAGYTAATRVREILGWADDDVPDLRTWLPQQGIALEEEASDTGWMCAVCTFDDDRARIVSNASYTSVSAPMRLASALGHLLLDLPRGKSFGVVSSPWAHWPATSRAKAFGAMLLMPDKAVRTIARTVSAPIDLVEKVIDTFRVGPVVATWHLYNLGLLGEEDRENALLRYESRSSRLQRSD